MTAPPLSNTSRKMNLSLPQLAVNVTVMTITIVFTLTICSSSLCRAFTSPSKFPMSIQPQFQQQQQQSSQYPLPQPLTLSQVNSNKSTKLFAIPTLDNWQLTKEGSAVGRVSNHPDPNIFDGEIVTTSPLKNSNGMREGLVVVTSSGSRYKLGKPKFANNRNNNNNSSNNTNSNNNSNSNTNNNNNNAAVNPPASSSSFSVGWIFGGSSPPPSASSSSSSSSQSRSPPTPSSRTPSINEWYLSFRGELIGVVTNHPNRNIADYDTITTTKVVSPNRNSLKEGDVVTTSSGSTYLLGSKKRGGGGGGGSFFNNSPSAEANGGTFKADVMNGLVGLSKSFQLSQANTNNNNNRPSPSPSSSSSSSSQPFNPLGTFFAGFSSTASSSPSSTPSSSSPSSSSVGGVVSTKKQEMQKQKLLKKEYGINGKTLANGKYLLCDRPRRSTSGKSNIWGAYKADENGNPIGDKLTIKVSTNFDSMVREDNNYNKVCSGLFPGRFVEKSEFLQVCDGYPLKEFETSCALVIENGRKDLRAILNERGYRGFDGKAMRDAASAALQCIQAMHSTGFVWTDLKTENFVIVSDEIGDNGMLPGVKGIDLESAIPRGGNPVDFSPEACPPEFATAFISGEGLQFTLDYSYDIWSYGMMLYELTTGKPYFDGKTPAQITMMLQYEFEPDLSAVSDDKLRDLIGQCLRYDPRKRPGVTNLLLHPYFLTSGIGPFGF